MCKGRRLGSIPEDDNISGGGTDDWMYNLGGIVCDVGALLDPIKCTWTCGLKGPWEDRVNTPSLSM